VIKSIYKKIAEDFDFLTDYDYRFASNTPHYVYPSVRFRSDKVELWIGYDHEEDRITLYRYIPADSCNGEDLLKGIGLDGKKYEDQVEQVKEILIKVLGDRQQTNK
jgi:hypothetical protein